MNIVNDETVAESDTSSSSSETSNPTIHKIEIKNFDFSPTELRIKVGDSVEWTNMDSVGHTVTSDSGKELDSSLLSKGKTYSHTFASTGTYEYHCSPHPYMKSKIIVE
ncbi:cupredoxin family copper-binding protein [Candidatus Pacearchaeota archaeon]|nr:cupredoxin family copper-binding protein [Candidatus Pacearchaeota archaeon]